MFQRLIKPSKSNSFFVFGARGTGKSTFIQHQFLRDCDPSAILSIDLLLPEVEDQFARQPDRLKAAVLAHQKEKKLEWVFIDEVQKVARLLDVVHHLIETEKVKFILTGSSARKLKRGSANLLAGRAFVYGLHPFCHLELADQFNLEDALHWGLLPKVVELALPDDKQAFLKSYALTYLKEEIQLEQLVRRLDPFRAFLEVAAQSNGQIINFSSIAREIGADHKTIQSYFEILEDTHLGFLLSAYHRSVRKAQASHPKFYFFDTGVKRALDRTLDIVLKPKTFAFGAAFEHLVVLEIYKLNQILQTDYRLSYFNSRGTEVDLILSKPNQEILIEIKSSANVDPLKVKKLASLAADFPKAKIYWLSLDRLAQQIENVACRFWQEGLKEIFKLP